jgi:beta-galactosidase
MEEAHLHMVRVGEFAWSRMEPAEGRYDLDWLERAVRLAERHHIAVVLGTPTDAPPAWLTAVHPETLREDASGHRAEHGERRQFNYANPLFGNEFSSESFDPETKRQFHNWLQRRFGTLDALNRDWTTAYWSQNPARLTIGS